MFSRDGAAIYLELQRRMIAASYELEEVMRLIVEGAVVLMPKVRGAAVELIDGDMLEYRACSGSASPHLGFRMPIEGSISGHCLTERRPFLCNDVRTDERVNRAACEQIGVLAMIVVPIFANGVPEGVLVVMSDEPGVFGEDELILAELFAAPIMIGIAARHARAQAQEKLQLERRFRAMFDHAAVGIAHTDADGRLLAVNGTFCRITGRTSADLVGSGFRDITHPEDLSADNRHFDLLVKGEIESFTVEKRYILPSGVPKWVRLTASAVHDSEGRFEFCVSIIEDIGKQKQAQEEVLSDPLTALRNRRWLTTNLPHALVRNCNMALGVGIAFIDLDGFKSVNDRFGHDMGDRCLIGVADAIRDQIADKGEAVRLSGDEFIAVLEGSSETDLAEMGDHIRAAICDLSARQGWAVDASIGTVFIRGGHQADALDVIKQADDMMYRAKRAGGGQQAFTTLR